MGVGGRPESSELFWKVRIDGAVVKMMRGSSGVPSISRVSLGPELSCTWGLVSDTVRVVLED